MAQNHCKIGSKKVVNQEKPLPKTVFRFALHFLAPYKIWSGFFLFCAIVSGLYGVVNYILLKVIINLLESARSNAILTIVFWPALFYIINFVVHDFTWRGRAYISYKIQPIIKNNIISQTFSYVCKHSHQFFQDNLSGKIFNNISMLANSMERILHEIMMHVIRGGVLLIGALISMFLVHPLFFWGLFLWSVLFCAISWIVSKKIVHLSDAYAESESVVSGQIVDSLSNTQNIRLFASYDYEISYLSRFLKLMQDKFRNKEWFLFKFHIIQNLSVVFMLAFMMYTLIRLRAQDVVTIGDFALILGLSLDVGFTLYWVTEQIDYLNDAVGKCKQSLRTLFTPLEIQDHPNAKRLIVKKGEIEFDKVQFQYKGVTPLFQNKSVVITSGSKVGLVGYSGSGKSTFVNLILRLFDVSKGHVLIDGQDIQEVTQDSLRSSIGMIPQEPSLFHRTLMENIRYGRIDASDEEVIAAAKRAHAHEFILRLPEKYESLVGERGIKLSGGQRQRVAIARAMLKNAPILILDEATSQLDSVTESYIQESLWALMQNKTTLVIAHRLSTLLHMDRILVFDQGKIVEDGMHQQLLAKQGLYKILWDAQVGGFLPDKKNAEEI